MSPLGVFTKVVGDMERLEESKKVVDTGYLARLKLDTLHVPEYPEDANPTSFVSKPKLFVA